MSERIVAEIKRSLEEAGSLYYRLVLLVGEAGSGKTAVLQQVAADFGTSVINVNLKLSRELLELGPKQRSLRIPDILDKLLNESRNPVVLDNLEILFHEDLKQDPLRLLQRISRNRSVIASWNGKFDGNRLIYAEMGHSEYRIYETVDARIVEMAGVPKMKAEKL